MALEIGDIVASSGLAKRIYDNMVANAADCGFGAADDPTVQDTNMKALAYCIAKAVVDEIHANAEIDAGSVNVTIPSSQGGLQTSTAAGNPTNPPASDQVLFGACFGAIV
jgi:hypothetical protein